MSEEVAVSNGTQVNDDLGVLDVTQAVSVMEVKNNRGEILRHPDGRPFTITFRSKDSEQVVNLARAQSDRRIAINARQQVPIMSGVIDKDNIELLVVATVEWDILLDGKKPPSRPEEYRRAYTRLRALYEQGDQHLGIRAHFTKA